MKIFLLLFLVTGCAGQLFKGSPRQGKTIYSYADEGGNFKFVRESKKIKQKLVTRNQILDTKGSASKVLEKSIIVSQVGSIKSGKDKRLLIVRPQASEFTVWLDGKKYTSTMKINSQTKSMRVTLDSPETRWQGTSEFKFPRGRHFCFFNQIPECLYHNNLLVQALQSETRAFDFYVVWDGYPFIQDQLTRVGKSLFAPASIKFDGEIKGQFRYIVEVEGQMVLYHFTKSFDLVKIAWIAQGITVVPPGEEIADE